MDNIPVHKLLIVAGIVLITGGVLWYFLSDKLSWLGHLPGDIRIERPGFRFYFPFTTLLLVSLILNIVILLVRYFW
jgi:hypothetical protein